MAGLFTRTLNKKRRRSSVNDAPSASVLPAYVGPRRRSSEETIVVSRLDSSQENYGQLANDLSEVNRTLNLLVRNILTSDNTHTSLGLNSHPSPYDENDSDDTAASIDSAQIEGFRIFGRELGEYNAKRTLPIVSLTFKSGYYLFPSAESVEHFKKSHKWKLAGSPARRTSSSSTHSTRPPLEQVASTSNSTTNEAAVSEEKNDGAEASYEEDSDLPLFKVFTPPLSQFRKNCPYLVIKKYLTSAELRERVKSRPELIDDQEEMEKYVFCKVYDKYMKQGVKRFTLEIFPNPNDENESIKVVMFTHRFKPYTDTIYKGTKLRFVGTSVCTSVFGSNAIRLMVMNEPGARSLMDDMTDDNCPNSSNPLLKVQTTMNDLSGSAINHKIYGNSTLPPLAKFVDTSGESFPKKYNKVGYLTCYESLDLTNREEVYSDYSNVKQVKFDTLVLTCMMLTLREQEDKKNLKTAGGQCIRGISYYGSGGVTSGYGIYENPFSLGGTW